MLLDQVFNGEVYTGLPKTSFSAAGLEIFCSICFFHSFFYYRLFYVKKNIKNWHTWCAKWCNDNNLDNNLDDQLWRPTWTTNVVDQLWQQSCQSFKSLPNLKNTNRLFNLHMISKKRLSGGNTCIMMSAPILFWIWILRSGVSMHLEP